MPLTTILHDAIDYRSLASLTTLLLCRLSSQNCIIGKHPHVSNLVLCNGFSGHGLQQAPGAGRAVAELITTGSYRTVDVSCFSFERVLNEEPLYEKNIV